MLFRSVFSFAAALPQSGLAQTSDASAARPATERPKQAKRKPKPAAEQQAAAQPVANARAQIGAVPVQSLDTITAVASKTEERAIDALAARFGNRLVTSQAVREQHAHTTTWLPNQPPDAVVMAQETADIQDVVRICAANRVPVIAFGTGTSLEGQVNAPAGGVCIDLRDMNKVLEVHAEDLDCVIQPGVTRKALNEHLRDQGLFFPIDPGADASLGGMTSTRASGTNAVRYGTMRENVLALKVVLVSGSSVPTLVFDEVDSGVGGATAAAVGDRLARVADRVQVLVVTHSPQVAARGVSHLRVAKEAARGRAETRVLSLDPPARREEIARMLGGVDLTEQSLAHARQMVTSAQA